MKEKVNLEEKYKEARPFEPAFPYWSIFALNEIKLIEENERFEGLFHHPLDRRVV
ncbi:hypothetical protein [Domibacillus aminovorans]|uniref:hypothetical protein n=1 Tax=Domibacillus aminovorans TaxID=29332 RepID=UPI000ADD5BD0|nr:hypothetical protein [Domibacillus aminovorans]